MNIKKEFMYRISEGSVITMNSPTRAEKMKELKEKITSCGSVSSDKKIRLDSSNVLPIIKFN